MVAAKISPRKSDPKKVVHSTAIAKLEPLLRRPLFRDGSFFDSIPLNHLEDRLSEKQFLSDLIVDCCLEYIKKNVIDDAAVCEETAVMNSFEFSRLKRAEETQKLLSNSLGFDDHPQQWSNLFDKIYKKLRPAGLQNLESLLNRKLIILPAFWCNHWFLIMIVDIQCCTINDQFVEEYEQFLASLDPIHDLKEFLHEYNDGMGMPCDSASDQSSETSHRSGRKPLPKRKSCKIVFMDSKIKDSLNGEILKSIHAQAFLWVKQWIKTLLFKFGSVPTNQFKQIRCHNLPQQLNDTDCGLYLVKYAEYFAAKERNWMDYEEEAMEKLSIEDSPQFQYDVAGSRKWIRSIVDRLSGF